MVPGTVSYRLVGSSDLMYFQFLRISMDDSSFDILVDDEDGSYDAEEHLKLTELSLLI